MHGSANGALPGAADPVDAWGAQGDNLAEGRGRSRANSGSAALPPPIANRARIAELDYKSARA
eukprot:7618229-Pyramimonas_sp.AAC.1